MDASALHGMHPAVVTPFTETGEIMEDAFQEIVEFLIGRGATGVCVAGDNGESWALSAQERGRLVRLAVDRSAGRVPITCGCSAPTLAAARSYGEAARDNGARALLSMPPTYVLKGSRAEILRRYEAVGQLGPPLILYNSPRRAGYSLSVEDVAAAMDVAPVIGIKESSRDFFHHTHMLDAFRDRIAVMTGPCHYIVPSVPLGATGFIATGPEFLGDDAPRIMNIARTGSEIERRRVHTRLTGVYELLMGVGTWPSAFKAALNLVGLPAGVPRDPVMAATPDQVESIRRRLDELGLS